METMLYCFIKDELAPYKIVEESVSMLYSLTVSNLFGWGIRRSPL